MRTILDTIVALNVALAPVIVSELVRLRRLRRTLQAKAAWYPIRPGGTVVPLFPAYHPSGQRPPA